MDGCNATEIKVSLGDYEDGTLVIEIHIMSEISIVSINGSEAKVLTKELINAVKYAENVFEFPTLNADED